MNLYFRLESKDYIIYLYFLVFSFITLILISQDSYLHDLYGRTDSAWFFMCGKAWMNGLTPYVDFSDSKGPLLWLIYGIGYLLSHYNYIGIFWISVVWYSFIYFYVYKTAYVILNDRRKSILVAICMTMSFFTFWFHNETRAEDFCLLFMIISLYEVCRLLYSPPVLYSQLFYVKKAFFVLGICSSSLFLIKFNIAAMHSIFVLYTVFWYLKRYKNWLFPIIIFLLGFILILLPFIVYFLLIGNCGEFFQEYLLNTFRTVSEGQLSYFHDWLNILADPKRLAFLLFLIIGSIIIRSKLLSHKLFPAIITLFIFALTVRHSYFLPYYFNICSFLMVFLFIGLVESISRKLGNMKIIVFSLFIIIGTSLTWLYMYGYPTFFLSNSIDRDHFNNINTIISKKENPKILNLFSNERGYGISSGTLPSGKYWSLQLGAPKEMIKDHVSILKEGKADFIYVGDSNDIKEMPLTGYKEVYSWDYRGLKSMLYARKDYSSNKE